MGVGGSSTQSLTLTNNGGLSLDGLVFAISGDFAVTANIAASSVAGGSSCNLQVTFSPASTGSRSGNLLVTSSSAAAFNLPLNGNGMDFQLVIVGSPSATVVTGQTADFTLSVEPVGASTGNITITCEGAPKNSTCVVSPDAAQMTAGNSVFVSVRVVTGITTPTNTARDRTRQALSPFSGGLFVVAALLPFGYPRKADARRSNSVSVRRSGVVVSRLRSHGERRKAFHSGQSRSCECDSGRQLHAEHFRDIRWVSNEPLS